MGRYIHASRKALTIIKNGKSPLFVNMYNHQKGLVVPLDMRLANVGKDKMVLYAYY